MAAAPVASMGMVNDPRLNNDGRDQTEYPQSVLRKLHDPSLPIEEYMYWAKITRADEERLYGPNSGYKSVGPRERFFKEKILRKSVPANGERNQPARLSISAQGQALGNRESFSEKQTGDGNTAANTAASSADGKSSDEERPGMVVISDAEWLQASRAARTATWGAIFYLITTDILGPFSTGYAFSQLGFGPGIALFTVFGGLAGYTGYELWRMYMQLDSDRYPMKGYGDIGFRIYGTWFRHCCNVLQSFQFFMNVAIIAISSGQSISQMSKEGLCFIVCILVCVIFGCLVGQIRTLQRFGWLASFAVFLNLLIIFFSMGVMAHSPPNYQIIAASYPAVLPNVSDPAPIFYYAGLPPGLTLADNVNGLMNAVFSFGGATLFCELMAEMRRPMDFWKGLLCADILIYIIYMVYGCYTYGMQGQYVYNTSYQGLSPYAWQTFGNVLGLISGLIAAVLYGNIGIKVFYNNIGRDVFKFPLLESRVGKFIWIGFVPLYWTLAFIVGTSVPQITSWITLVGAVAILQFTYTFPPFMMIGFKCQRDAILPEETFDHVTGVVKRVDSGVKRWMRGFKKELWWNSFDLIFFLGSCTTAVLGTYAAIVTMNAAYHNGSNLTGWSCKSPTG